MDLIITPLMIILGKYALDKGVELGKEVGPKALDTAKEIFSLTLQHLRQDPKDKVIVDEFEKSPEVYEKPVEQKLTDALLADSDFAAKLNTLLSQYNEAAEAHKAITGIKITGTGAVGDGAVAASGGSVAVGGNVEGGIHLTREDKDDK